MGPSVIQFSVIESMSPDLLARLARRVGDETAVRCFDGDLAAWMYQTATRDDLSESVRETFDGIAALASEDGAEVLLGSGLDRGVDLAQRYGPRSCSDLAVLACLEHHDVFGDARAQVRAVNRRLFAVHVCNLHGFLAKADLIRRVPELERAISSWLARRGRPAGVRAIVTENGEQIVLDIVTQRTPNRCTTLEGAPVLACSKRQDTMVFERGGGCLSIHARSASEVDFYRVLAGTTLLNDGDAFRSARVFHLRRLLSPSEWEAKPVAVPGLVKVLLRSVEVRTGAQRTRWQGAADLSARDPGVADLLDGADECTRIELEIHSDGRAYPCAVEILSPNRIYLDQRAIGSIASTYLRARGLVVEA